MNLCDMTVDEIIEYLLNKHAKINCRVERDSGNM